MHTTKAKIVVRVAPPGRGGGDLPGFLDMLRYDRARVVDWTKGGDDAFVITMESERFTMDRWASFGLYPEEERWGRA